MVASSVRAVFVGCARDCAAHLHNVIVWIEKAGTLFSSYRVVVVENDSSDDTKQILHLWSLRNSSVEIVCLDGLHDRLPDRGERLAAARNAYLKHVQEKGYDGHDLLIPLDMDGVVGPEPSLDRFSAALEFLLGDESVAGVFANSWPVYYDLWPLRHKEWCPRDCWQDFREKRVLIGPNQAFHQCVIDRQIPIAADRSPIEVESAFGGLGIYRMAAVKGGEYIGVTPQGTSVCDHVGLNATAALRGRLYILPDLMVEAPLEHIGARPEQTKIMTLEDGNCRIALLSPAEHMLDSYRSAHPLYDRRLPTLATILSQNNHDGCVLDVGSNIGDTAALIKLSAPEMPIVGIEGSSFYFRFAELNKKFHKDLFENVEFHWGLVGTEGVEGHLVASSGTAKLERIGPGDEDPILMHRPSVLRFTDVMRERSVSLLKVDIDGLDYAVLSNEYDFILEKTPIIWTEAQTSNYKDEQSWKKVLNKISGTWTKVIAFDNFGFGYLTGDTNSSIESILDFLSYCRRQRQHANLINNNVRSHYADIVLFPERFSDLADDFYRILPEFEQI